jgi:hypothetical protein
VKNRILTRLPHAVQIAFVRYRIPVACGGPWITE